MAITKVVEKLYRGPAPSGASDALILEGLGVTMTVDLQTAWDNVSYSEDVFFMNRDMQVKHMPIADLSFPSWEWLKQILDVIRSEMTKGGAVYVHCTHGVDRTGLVMCLYRIQDCSWTVEAAIAEWRGMGMHWFPYLFPFNWPGKVRAKMSVSK